ncbi:PHB depolymerase family esterase [Massilia sp. 2TAF26]|uniref:extracellular catalytic domain type 1 short-chain-length polyhydroxyalkanoate depolymerase n=1 Tax=Massilia sp. 2TAF26 TaxID=3233012 RepID=UPI003F9717DA
MFNTVFDAWPPFAIFSGNGHAAPSPPAGEFASGYHEEEGQTLRYRLFIPSDARSEPMPLVVMLHGCGQDAADFARGTGMNTLAEEYGCLVLYPEQSCSAHWNRCWNWYDQDHQRRGEGEPALIAGLTRRIMVEHAVDARRVAVAGLSSGGAMAVILGRTYPDLFSAVGCHSGLAHGSATSGIGAMLAMRDGHDPAALAPTVPHANPPVIVFHGDADATVNRKNSNGVVRQSVDSDPAHRRGKHADIAIVEETGCSGGRKFTRQIHRKKNGSVLAEQWTVHGTGHVWSGGNPHGSYTDIQGPNASEEMLRFFMNHPAAA